MNMFLGSSCFTIDTMGTFDVPSNSLGVKDVNKCGRMSPFEYVSLIREILIMQVGFLYYIYLILYIVKSIIQ